MRAALEVPADLNVLVVTKDRITESNSSYAQGGIAGVLSPEDRFENHVDDTLVAATASAIAKSWTSWSAKRPPRSNNS